MFQLDKRLQDDSVVLGEFPLSRLLMSRDARYPWCILVPRLAGVTELYQLAWDDMEQLMRESRYLSEIMMTVFKGDKLNVAALGNVVNQLHLHHVVRYKGDSCWPGPVWGAKEPLSFEGDTLADRVELIQANLKRDFKPA